MAKPTMASHFLLLVLALSAFSVSSDLLIDCGASDSYTDDNSIYWTGDSDLIQTGQPQVVQATKSISHVMDTLRVFTTRKKNCYSYNEDTGVRVLVRADFYYANYDKKSAPPTFDLLIDGNLWATVETSATEVVTYEIIYLVTGGSISVCLAQTKPNQFPIISALAIRAFDSHMYKNVDSNHFWYSNIRIGYGADGIVRYSNDSYDRIWQPVTPGNGLVKVTTSDEIAIDTSTALDDPPEAVVRNAITPSNASHSIRLINTFPTTFEVPVFINMYFSEVTQLDSTQKRSFELFLDGNSISEPIIPTYGKVSEYYVSNFTGSSNTSLVLTATSDSTLPPLINAMEVFYISDQLTDGTNSKDVQGLGSLIDMFSGLEEWSGGDPCLPAPYTWEWVNCSSDATPRVTALYLRSFDLSGLLPDFSSMDALETIDFSNNSLSGPIPEFLGSLPNLKQLNLADNQFSGTIPSSLSKNNKIKLVLAGNQDLCTSGKSCQTTNTPSSSDSPIYRRSGGNKKGNKLPVILGTSIPSFFAFWAIVGGLVVCHHKKKTAAAAAAVPAAGKIGGGNKPNGPQQGNMAGGTGQPQNYDFNININVEEQAFVDQDSNATQDRDRTN